MISTDKEIRMECVRLALAHRSDLVTKPIGDVIEEARNLADFVAGYSVETKDIEAGAGAASVVKPVIATR